VNDADLHHLRRAVELAEIALDAGEKPYGSVLVGADGTVLMKDHNRTSGGDQTRHPEFELARWAANHMTPEARAAATVYTSGEHCAMCSAAHGWAGLGRIVIAASSAQLRGWASDLGAPPPRVAALAINEVVPDLPVDGPVEELAQQVRELQRRFFSR
jgi:tRNA(Arg) A34 adenosine deaminase TadA